MSDMDDGELPSLGSATLDRLASLGVEINKGGANALVMKEFLDLLEQYDQVVEVSGTKKWFVDGTPFSIDNLPKHKMFFKAGSDYNERLFMASNRTGKTIGGGYELALHLTGEYPFWWQGKRFDHEVHCWAVGSTARTTRDVVQKELLGPIGAWGTGMIPKDRLGRYWALAGVPQGVDVIEVKHVSGKMSTLGFKNYEQSLDAFYGTAKHVIWLDEECPDLIYNECLLRTMTTQGIMMVTFTPLKGLTPFVVRFCSKADFLSGTKPVFQVADEDALSDDEGEDARLANIKTFKAVVQAGWNDAPWLDEETKARMLSDTPPHLRAARSLGTPAMGSGSVYPIPLEEIVVTPFKIPDHYERMYALDVGWNRTAALWAARDPDTKTIYIIDEHYLKEQPPAVHAASIRSRGEWIWGVIDPASRGRSQVDGVKLWQMYKDLGLQIHKAKNEVESGTNSTYNLLAMGKIKVFNTLPNFAKEYMLYRRDIKGQIVKENDHLMDCLRYIVNNQGRFMTRNKRGSGGFADGSRKYDI